MIFSLIIALASTTAFAQIPSVAPTQNISTDSGVVYRLFATKSVYTFIKLNTRTGQIWQEQWNTEIKNHFEYTLMDVPLVRKDEEKNGRFFLYQ